MAVYVDCLTDNKNRTAADVRSAFTHAGGNLGTTGSVAFQFERKGSIAVEKVIHSDEKKVPDRENAVDEDEFMLAVAEAGGEDYEDAGEEWIVYTAYDKMQDVQKALEDQGIEVKGSELTMVPTTPTDVTVNDAKKVQRLIDRLEELEDVQNVYSTMNVTDEIAELLRGRRGLAHREIAHLPAPGATSFRRRFSLAASCVREATSSSPLRQAIS